MAFLQGRILYAEVSLRTMHWRKHLAFIVGKVKQHPQLLHHINHLFGGIGASK